MPSSLQIVTSTIQLTTSYNRNQITNEVINNQERKRNIVAAAIKIENHKHKPKSNITTTSTTFQQDIKLLQSLFLNLSNATLLFKEITSTTLYITPTLYRDRS